LLSLAVRPLTVGGAQPGRHPAPVRISPLSSSTAQDCLAEVLMELKGRATVLLVGPGSAKR